MGNFHKVLTAIVIVAACCALIGCIVITAGGFFTWELPQEAVHSASMAMMLYLMEYGMYFLVGLFNTAVIIVLVLKIEPGE